jgi:deoxyribodipyrimidine photolyase-related protein
VEITNTRGMSQYADGGIVATKPYVSSASYINKMGDYCSNCHYDYKKKTGKNACPFNSLYWNFIDANMDKLENNQRMSMMLALWRKMSSEKQKDILEQAREYLEKIETL